MLMIFKSIISLCLCLSVSLCLCLSLLHTHTHIIRYSYLIRGALSFGIRSQLRKIQIHHSVAINLLD